MLTLFLKSELKAVDASKLTYLTQKHKADTSVSKAKNQAKQLMGEPGVLCAIFAAGAFKGAVSPNTTSQRNKALTTLARTGLFSLFH